MSLSKNMVPSVGTCISKMLFYLRREGKLPPSLECNSGDSPAGNTVYNVCYCWSVIDDITKHAEMTSLIYS